MIDILMLVDSYIRDDELIKKYVDTENNIFYNHYPEAESINGPIIVLDELSDPTPRIFGDNKIIAQNYLIQINVYTKSNTSYNARIARNEIMQRITDILSEEIGMENTSSSKPEYNPDYNVYLSIKRFSRTFYYDKNFEGEI